MANAGCINAIGFDGTYLRTLDTLDSANIGVGVQYCIPAPLDDKRLDYIKYTDKCGCTCCITGENEILVYATNGVIKNFTLTNDDTNEKVNVKWNDLFGSNRAYTMVRYKTGSYPTSITDGTLAVKETTQNQYSVSGYNVSGLTDGTTYYFTAFAVSQDGTIIVVQQANIKTDFIFYGYQKVEYIASSGTQRIDTGVKPDDLTYGLLGKFRITTMITSVLIDLSNTTSTDNKRYGFQFNGSNSKPQWSGIMYQQRGEDNGTINTSTDYEFSYNYNGDKSFTINGITHTGLPTGSATMPNRNIFCQNCNGNYQRFFYGRLYRLKIYHNTTLLRDFVPVYRKSDSVIGLLDIVNKVFYTNAGSGSFTKGPDIN